MRRAGAGSAPAPRDLMSRTEKAGAPGSGLRPPADGSWTLGAAAISKRVSAALESRSATPCAVGR